MTEQATKTCNVDGCLKPVHTKGYCGAHYHRVVRYGNPLYRPPVVDLSNVDKSLYRVWQTMKNRCYDTNVKSYPDYGGRGIGVCARWRSAYIDFVGDLGLRNDPGMTLERVNNDLGYTCGSCPECRQNTWPRNVIWATRRQQAQNTRRNHNITIDGETHPLSEWSRIRGLGRGTIFDRLQAGWPEYDAVMTPIGKRRAA